MSKENKELATKIVDHLCVPTKELVDVPPTSGEPDELPTETKEVYTSRVLVAGIADAFTADTKKQARQAAIDYLTHELDEGNLVLSDTWVEDNLQ